MLPIQPVDPIDAEKVRMSLEGMKEKTSIPPVGEVSETAAVTTATEKQPGSPTPEGHFSILYTGSGKPVVSEPIIGLGIDRKA